MLINTRGIIIKQIQYSDHQNILSVYTEWNGMQSFIVPQSTKKKNNIQAVILQPLFLVELEYYSSPKKSLHHLKYANLEIPYSDLPFNYHKANIGLFISDFLSKILRNEAQNALLFDFLRNSFLFFDHCSDYVNFHLVFLLKLSRFMGFFPESETSVHSSYFDLLEGRFKVEKPLHLWHIDSSLSIVFFQLCNTSYSQLQFLQITHDQRSVLLDKILEYYKLHTQGLSEFKSLLIMKDVYSL